MAIKHVSKAVGNDSNGGTSYPGDAYATLFKGLNNVGPNDLLKVYAGDYFETINSNTAGLTIPSGTSWSDAPLIQVNPGDTVRLLVGGGETLLNLVHAYIKYVEFDGFQFLGVNGIEESVLDNVISISSAIRVRFRNCIIRGAKGTGVFASKGSLSAPYITGHEFIDCQNYQNGLTFGGGQHHGYYISTSENLIKGGTCWGNSSFGVHMYQSGGDVTQNNTVDGLTTHDNSQTAATSAGILISNGSGHKVINCLTYDEKYGIRVGNFLCTNAKILNNIADGCLYSGFHLNSVGVAHNGTVFENNIGSNNGQYGLDIDASPVNTVYGYNLWYNNGLGTVRDNGTGSTDLGNNVLTDPLYTNRAGKIFTPTSSSPSIGAALTVVDVAFDINGIVRPQGVDPDMGAYEYVYPNITNAANSTVNTSSSSVPANGMSSAIITVTLIDEGLQPVPGKTVTLDDGAASSTIGAASGPSDANGQVTFNVTNTNVEAATYTATDTTDTVVITDTAVVTFTSVTSPGRSKSYLRRRRR